MTNVNRTKFSNQTYSAPAAHNIGAAARKGGSSKLHLAVALTAVLATLISICVPTLGTNAQAQAADISTRGAADQSDTSWRETRDRYITMSDGTTVDRKPMLYSLLGQNNKVETGADELRMDFILRVAHGEVDAYDTPSGGVVGNGAYTNPGMHFIYDYGDGTNSDGSYKPNYGHQVYYLNTLNPNMDTGGNNGTTKWAYNQDEYYTINKVIESGPYDYLTISLEADLNYPAGDVAAWWTNETKDGRQLTQHTYVVVGPDAATTGWDTYTTEQINNLTLSTNLTNDAPITVYPDWPIAVCRQSSTRILNNGCGIPTSAVGYDASPLLWSGYQANWGLDLDNEIPKTASAPAWHWQYNLDKSYASGVAPPKSFFTEWTDPTSMPGDTDPCYQHTSFKYQWFGLQNGTDWVPVTDLTPEAQQVDGQKPSWMNSSLPPTGEVGFNDLSAYNAPDPTGGTHDLMARKKDGSLQPAQNSDGSINFKKAMEDQENTQAKGTPGTDGYRGLDGYFKLVTWPVMSGQCSTSSIDPNTDESVLIPSKTNVGNPNDVSSKVGDSQADIQRRINVGWTIDTAYYKFDVRRPDVPTITGVSNGVDSTSSVTNPKPMKDIASGDADNFALGDNKATLQGKASDPDDSYPTIHGTGTAGDEISLYADEPSDPAKKVIKKSDPQETNTQGTLIGKVTVDSNGKWELRDATITVSNMPLTRRYHVYQSETTGMMLSSNFSKISVVHLLEAGNPSITDVTSTPAQGGTIAPNATVVVTGTAKNSDNNSATLSMTATPSGSTTGTISADSCTPSLIPVGVTEDYTCTFSNSASQFKNPSSHAHFDFTITMNDGLVSARNTSKNELVDFYAPKASMKVSKTGASGVMTSTLYDASHSPQDKLLGISNDAFVDLKWKMSSNNVVTQRVYADADGTWTAKLPSGVTGSGTVYATATDDIGGTSQEESKPFQFTPSQSALPFTGHTGWKLAATLIGVALVAIALALALYALRNQTNRGRHAIE